MDTGPSDAVISGPDWAGLGGLGENWTILTGIDFPNAGCWEITDEYLDQSLTFIVETIDRIEWRKSLLRTPPNNALQTVIRASRAQRAAVELERWASE